MSRINMNYCKFENTLAALTECEEGWEDVEADREGDRESKAKHGLIELMLDLLSREGYDIENIDDELK